MKRISKKGFVILFGSVVGVALIVWVVLVFGIFRKDKEEKPKKEEKSLDWITSDGKQTYDLPEVPDGYKLVFRETAMYYVSEDGKVVLGVKHDYDEAGELTKVVEYDEDGKYVGEVKYSTDPDGSTVARAYDDKKELAWESVRKKDSNGNTIEVTEKKTNSEGELVLTKEEIYEYDADGNKVRFTKYNGLGEVIDEIVYDSEGRILEEYSGWPKYYYEYDKNGNLLRKISEYDDVTGHNKDVKEEYQYAPDGRLLEYYSYGDTIKYEYDENGKRVMERKYDLGGTLTESTEYDERELPIKVETYYPDGVQVFATTTIEYDDSGNQITRMTYRDGEFASRYEMEYDEISAKYGRYTRVTKVDYDGTILGSTEYRYIEKNNLPYRVREMNYDGITPVSGWEIEMDEYGNEVRYKQYEDGKLKSQTVYEYRAFAVPDK